MPKKDESRISIRPSDKARIYLEELGFLDRRTGRKKNGSDNLNKFICDLIVIACESDKHPKRLTASSDELMAAWRRYSISIRNREIETLRQEQATIADWKG